MTDPDLAPHPIYARIRKATHDAASATAKRLGMSLGEFVEAALARHVVASSGEVAASDSRYQKEVERLVELSQSRDVRGQ